ncbi:hypothetical protein Agabi119p4_4320 [Agaricus bisporus var. burnettii]|uniref:Uncharacterized protein n=1 Tax=Agaricus bisporus var. burnettii TaxID=192524 RepID=A0A8H7F330_AGABI|nr:hypothetical protein Agabi119p4_4320 [Agaricus bisporus var. burnettii]
MPLSVDALPQPGLDDRLAEHPMPPAGPDFYNARRQLWLTPPQGRSHIISPTPSFSADLEDLLQADEALHANSCWNKGIGRVWARLSKGVRLKNRLPLGFVIKIVHASWVRNDTWPRGMRAPESDDELPAASVTQTAQQIIPHS